MNVVYMHGSFAAFSTLKVGKFLNQRAVRIELNSEELQHLLDNPDYHKHLIAMTSKSPALPKEE